MGMNVNEPTNLEIAEKFVVVKHWLWLPGMRDSDGWLVVEVEQPSNGVWPLAAYLSDGYTADGHAGGDIVKTNSVRMRPDLDHPATLGCIEHGIVPAALQDPDACLCFAPRERNWFVYSPKHDDCATSKNTKPAALLAALEEADDIVRRSTEPPIQVEDFGDADEFDDRDGDGYDEIDDVDDRDWSPRSGFTLPDAPAEPQPRCTRPPDPRAVAASEFLEGQRLRDAERDRQIERRRAKEPAS
jgi:hypothetical protein